MFFHNSFNYVRARHLHLISIEMLAIILAVWFCWRLKKEKRLTLEIAYFIALPFSDVPFRFASKGNRLSFVQRPARHTGRMPL